MLERRVSTVKRAGTERPGGLESRKHGGYVKKFAEVTARRSTAAGVF